VTDEVLKPVLEESFLSARTIFGCPMALKDIIVEQESSANLTSPSAGRSYTKTLRLGDHHAVQPEVGASTTKIDNLFLIAVSAVSRLR
jgi:hypothetical protein